MNNILRVCFADCAGWTKIDRAIQASGGGLLES
jgi:hypothetical protein